MRVARIAPAGAPPDPTVSVGYMSGFLRPPFFPSSTTPGAFRQVGVSQELPYPGKLALRSRVAATEADASRWSYEDVRLRLIADLKVAYVDYLLVDRTLAIVLRNKTALEQFRDLAEARFSVAKASQQDVLSAQLQLSILLERQATLELDRTTLRADINRLLYRPPDTPVPVSDLVVSRPAMESVETLRAQAADRYPALKRAEQQINRGQQALALARKEQLPDFGINVTTQKFVGGMPWMYGIDFMVKVPIFSQRKQRPMVAEAAAALDAASRMRESTSSEAASRVTQEHAAAATSQRLMDLYGDSVLPQARLTLESSVAAYEVGTVDFLTLLTNFITVLNYEISFEEQQARYRRALARLEPFVRGEFIR
jgi:outer membrane protein TolC